ncbi:MAG TPA: prolipoprotein diacylglyceryl transferase [Chloroflexota bacterium]|nr:prolipoprotein diacylglyceryl transferase [Chloroflexota bacterium]
MHLLDLPLAVIPIDINPVLIHFGAIAVHWYGLMYVVGIVSGLAVALPFAASRDIDRETAYRLFWPILVAALIGGRLYYVVQSNFGWYLRHPTQMFATWDGGMAFYGAIFLGGLAALAVCRRQGVSFPLVLDVAALMAPLAQAFGRVGNLINGDIIGYPSTLPWATRYTNAANTFVPSHVVAYQPAAGYELLFCLALFAVLWTLRRRLQVPGTLFALWLILYSVGQFVLFFERANVVVLWGLKQAQLTALAVIVLAIPLYLIWRYLYSSRSERAGDAESAPGHGDVAPMVVG